MRKKIKAKPSIKDKSYRANTRVDAETWDRINQYSESLGITPSSAVRSLILRALEQFEIIKS